MNEATKICLTAFCLLFGAVLCAVGFLMRKYDFSCFFDFPFPKTPEDKGLYLRMGPKVKKVAEDTPENRKKFSKGLGTYFIGLSILWVIVTLSILLYER
ncbi:MAG: hypothetical protein VB071_12945 [Lawsonibacter sp.]|nr:hypothetical protein [Lawsonibacter sp.]